MAIRKTMSKKTDPPVKKTTASRVTNPNYLPTRNELGNMTKEQRTQRKSNLTSSPTRDTKGRLVKGSKRK